MGPGLRRDDRVETFCFTSTACAVSNDLRHKPSFSRRIPPELCQASCPSKARGRREGRVAAAPGALAQKKLRKRESTGTGGDHTGLPCAVVLRLIRDLLGEPCRLPPSSFTKPVSFALDLSASLWGVRTTRFRRPRTAPFVLGTSASTASPLRVCDVRDTPLVSKRDVAMIADFRKISSAIFLRAELDGLTWLIALEKSRLGRRRVKQRGRGRRGPRSCQRAWRANQSQDDTTCTAVVPAKAGTHTAESFYGIRYPAIFATIASWGYRSRPSPGRR